jgi:hypothetical protein
LDWGAFEQAVGARESSAAEVAALVSVARRIVRAHGESVAPKHVDAFVRARSDAGADVAELALAQRAGDALVRFGTTRRASQAPPQQDLARELPVPQAAPPSAIPPDILAKMPASFFAQSAEGPSEDTILVRLQRRYGWVLDLTTIGIAMLLCWASFATRVPMGGMYDGRRALLARALAWIAGLMTLSAFAGFAQRAGLLEGPLYSRVGHPTMRLRMLQARALFALRGVLILVGCGLLAVFPPRLAGSTTEATSAEPARWPEWMTELGIFARPPGAWAYDRTSDLVAGAVPIHVAWLHDGEREGPPLHAIVVLRGNPTLDLTHAIAMSVSREIPRRTDGITCREELPVTRADVLCVRTDAPAPFVIACGAEMPGTAFCVASWGEGRSGDVARDLEGVLRTIGSQRR